MFFSIALAAKEHVLGKLWLAAHADRRLPRKDIDETSISQSVDEILQRIIVDPDSGSQPENERVVPLALRLSGSLLFGTVRIYGKQVTYLLKDCDEAIQKLDKVSLPSNGSPGVSSRKRKAPKAARNGNALLPEDDDLLDDPLAYLQPISDDAGLSLTDDKQSSSKAAYAEHHLQFMQMDLNHGMNSQLDGPDQGLFETSDLAGTTDNEPEMLREASVGAIGAHALGNMPRITPRAGSGRFSQSLPSRDGSNSLTPAQRSADVADLELPQPADPPLDTPGDLQPAPNDADLDPAPMDDAEMDPAAMNDADNDLADMDAEKDMPPAASPGPAPSPVPEDGVPAHDEQQLASVDMLGTDDAVPGTELDAAPGPAPQPAQPAIRKKGRAKPNKTLSKLYATPDNQDVRLPRAEMRALIRDRSPLMHHLPHPSEVALGEDDEEHDDFDAFLRRGCKCVTGSLDGHAARFFRALASAKPIPRAVWARDEVVDAAAADDEIEDAEATDSEGAGPSGRGGDVEVLRDAGAARPAATPAALNLGGQGPGAELSPDAAAATPGSLPPTDELAEPEPLDPMDEIEPPQFDDPDEMDAPAGDIDPMADDPQAAAGSSGFADPAAAAGNMNADDGMLFTQAPDSQVADDNSLNAHTLATLARLEQIATGTSGGSKKRQRGENAWVPLPDVFSKVSREEAAKTFYDALVLQGKGLIRIAPQAAAFDVLQMQLVEVE